MTGPEGAKVLLKRAKELRDQGQIVAEDRALTTRRMRDAEALIRDDLREHAWDEDPVSPPTGHHETLRGAQAEAYWTALRKRVAVISGGAGVGKTYVVAKLAAALREAGLNVALCAPTGKAAQRIEDTLRGHGVGLKAQTIHRLLRYDGIEFRRDSLSEASQIGAGEKGEAEPAYDAVIVDEVSMVDVPLMAELLKRIDFGRTRLVLVGDHNQLPPVGPGNVLRDIMQYRLAPTVVLNEVVRQAGVLEANSSGILSGRVAPSAGPGQGWIVMDGDEDPEKIQLWLRDLIEKRMAGQSGPLAGFDPLKDVQILTPMHKGPLGTEEINRRMRALFRGETKGRFSIGDKVIQTSNDYDLGVMNGTIGYVLDKSKEGGFLIGFDGVGPRFVEADRLREVELAYALTAHKAQGSEFPCVIVICHSSYYFRNRNWLYTAVTRAQQACVLVGDKRGLETAAGRNDSSRRRTLLGKWAEDAREAGTAEAA